MNTRHTAAIRPKERDTVIQALRAGVVPKTGLHHIQVGRASEVAALIQDIDRIVDGGSAVRFVIGEYGAGKTFFLNLVRLIALEKRLITLHADLGPDRRLHATGGQARALYAESVLNLATRTKPEGGALTSIVERFVTEASATAHKQSIAVEEIIREKLAELRELVGCFDFAAVIAAFWRASEAGDEDLRNAALRWLRGEYVTRTDVRAALGIRSFIDDAGVYDHWKLLARFVQLAGYAGLLIVLDEMVNIYKLQNAQARAGNYEQVLRIVNDVLQGSATSIGFLFGGTPEFLLDTRRGVFSYEALQSRLQENSFARNGLVDLSGPVIRLQALTPEDLHVLLEKVRSVFASADQERFLVPDEALAAFMHHCSQKIGEAYFRTPRTTVKAFVQLLSVLEQNPDALWNELLTDVEPEPDVPEEVSDIADDVGRGDDELTSFRL